MSNISDDFGALVWELVLCVAFRRFGFSYFELYLSVLRYIENDKYQTKIEQGTTIETTFDFNLTNDILNYFVIKIYNSTKYL